jgi:integrase/recombinase XerD
MPKANGSGQALVLSQEEANAIIEACSPVMRAVFSFARGTAARISEVLSLRFENVTTTCIVLPKRITKGKKRTREVPINDRLAGEIDRYKLHWEATYSRAPDGGDYLFPARTGGTKEKHLTRVAAHKALDKICTQQNIGGASTHSWRRTSLTNANDAGVSLRVLQACSGHSNLDVLSRYLQTSDARKRQAANAFG